MSTNLPRCWPKRVLRLVSLFLFAAICTSASLTHAATNKSPVLISDANSTRAVALEAVTLKAEPFPLTSTVKFSNDTRTRICIFAMNLELLPGEGANAFSADAQDAAGKRYPLRIEFVGAVPPALDAQGNITSDFRGITMIVVRLADDMGDVGDVLLSLNLHGMSSNRVRVAIGHTGGGPADDAGSVPTPAPASPPPVDPPLVPDAYTGPASDADAVRFLDQAAWGPNAVDLAHVKAVGFQAYLNEQFNAPVANPGKGSNYPDLTFPLDDQATACPSSSPGDPNYNQNVCNRDNFSMYPLRRTFFTGAMYGQDQLRQRVAFALHQILVVSGVNPLNRGSWMTIYLQSLDRHAFGNYRTLLNEVTLNPSMGEYLDMRLSTRTSPNENWAREVLQLFSIGVNELNIDGTPKLDGQGMPIPSYSQTTVNEFTKVFTGWNLSPTLIGPGINNWRDPMVPRAGTAHDGSAKTLLNNQVVASCGNNQACAQTDLTAALDNIFNHPNVGPFIGKQLIQHLVTSNPSPAYVARVARVFNNDCDALYPAGCSSTRGNLRAVVQAILLDPEARGDVKTAHHYGKLREPAQYIVGVLRALNVKSFDKLSTSDGVLDTRSTVDFTGSLDQPVFTPTTVFSYYQPEYEVPGTKILGPAFGILSTSTTLRRANNVNTLIYTGVSANLTSPTAFSPDRPKGTSVDLANLEANASNPDAIADQLNALMLHGTMSTEVRNSIKTAMNAIPTSDAAFARKRAQVAAYLVATSSQYDIQR
ncbi:MAG: DUF1800 domain-containing protein [Pyrinomonadaceae bacterium]|nr:DUF1800 domain-containing protein [Pyrinomonadaceae bacterium]